MKKTRISIVLAALFLSGSALAAKSPRLHLDVVSPAGENSRLNLLLDQGHSPFEEALSKSRVGDSLEVTASRLRTAWSQVTRSEGMYTIAVEDEAGVVKVSEKDGQAVIEKELAPGKRVVVRVPVEAMDALLAGASERLDYDGALRALQSRGKGEAIAVEGVDGGKARIWID